MRLLFESNQTPSSQTLSELLNSQKNFQLAIMTFSLNLRAAPHSEAQAELFLMLAQKRDKIGNTPDLVADGSSEIDDALYEAAAEISWSQRVSGRPIKTIADIRNMELDETEFLLMVAHEEGDEDVDIQNDLFLLWMEDMDATVWDPVAPFGHLACYPEVLQPTCIATVRAVINKGNYLLGSIDGQPPSVFIPKALFCARLDGQTGKPITPVPLDQVDGEDLLHAFYSFELEFTPGMRNMWKATHIHRKLPTGAMRVLDTDTDDLEYVLHTPPAHIGAIIGKGGKNIDALIHRRRDIYGVPGARTDVPPEFTLTPSECGWKTHVRVEIPTGCDWGRFDVEDALSTMHY